MDLKDFVRQSIVEIANGIKEADQDLKETNAVVNPLNIVYPSLDNVYAQLDPKSRQDDRPVVELLEFDVAVFAKEGSEAKGGIGLSVGSISIGAHGKSDESKSSESRIKFKVPVVWPYAEQRSNY